MRNGIPKTWSACRWEMKIVSMSPGDIPNSLNRGNAVGAASNMIFPSMTKLFQSLPNAKAFPDPKKTISTDVFGIRGLIVFSVFVFF